MTDQSSNSELLKAFLASNPHVKHLALVMVSYTNAHYSKVITIHLALEIASLPHPSAPATHSDGPMHLRSDRMGNLLEECIVNNVEDDWIPDWTTLKLSAGQSDTAQGLVSTNNKQPDIGFSTDPRKLLKRSETEARDSAVEFKIGYEIEFHLLSSAKADQPISSPGDWLNRSNVQHEAFKVVLAAVGTSRRAVFESGGISQRAGRRIKALTRSPYPLRRPSKRPIISSTRRQ